MKRPAWMETVEPHPGQTWTEAVLEVESFMDFECNCNDALGITCAGCKKVDLLKELRSVVRELTTKEVLITRQGAFYSFPSTAIEKEMRKSMPDKEPEQVIHDCFTYSMSKEEMESYQFVQEQRRQVLLKEKP